jgi:hypothetical protein
MMASRLAEKDVMPEIFLVLQQCIRLDGSGVIMNIGAICPPPGLSLSLMGHNGCVLV